MAILWSGEKLVTMEARTLLLGISAWIQLSLPITMTNSITSCILQKRAMIQASAERTESLIKIVVLWKTHMSVLTATSKNRGKSALQWEN